MDALSVLRVRGIVCPAEREETPPPIDDVWPFKEVAE
jgi:hypothetical protein